MISGLRRQIILISILIGCGLSVVILKSFTLHKPIPSPQVLGDHADVKSPGVPVRLRIPSIKVDALIESVGLTPQGAMDVPKKHADVAWFNQGSRPGDNGSAVIAGHYGFWKSGGGSVFDDLNHVTVGDKIYTEDENGVTTTFLVREIRRYNPNDDAALVFHSHDDQAHLNLITCDGVWNETQKSYSNRLVIFTDKIMP